MYATNYFEKAILNLLRGVSFSAPTTVYLALFLNSPTETGQDGTEIAYTGYARQAVTFSAPAVMNGGIGIKNAEDITFPTSPSAAGTVTHVGIMDSLTAGNMLIYGELTDPLVVAANEAPVVVAEEAQWWLSGNMSNAYKTKILNTLRATNCAGFVPYLSLFNGNPDNGGSELSGTGYERVSLTFGAPAEQSSGQMLISNSMRAATARAGSSWGTWTYTAIYDAPSNGNPVFYIARSSKEFRKGLMAIVDVGNLSLAVN